MPAAASVPFFSLCLQNKEEVEVRRCLPFASLLFVLQLELLSNSACLGIAWKSRDVKTVAAGVEFAVVYSLCEPGGRRMFCFSGLWAWDLAEKIR